MARYYQIDQRSREWFAAKLGVPSASNAHKLVTPKGKLSTQAEGYMHTLLAELMLGHPIETPETAWMVRGTELEESAMRAYEFQSGNETEDGGWVTTDDGRYGCSPDRLIGNDGVLELKCPAPHTHVRYLIEGCMDDEKRPQVQMQMLVTGRAWVDLVSYHPELPIVITRVERDEEYIVLLANVLDAFCDQIAGQRKQLEAQYGPFPEPPAETAESPEEDHFGITESDLEAILESRK